MKTTEIGNEIEGAGLNFTLEIGKVRYVADILQHVNGFTWGVAKYSINNGKFLQAIGLPFGSATTYNEAQDAVLDALNGLRPEAHRIAREGQ